MRDFLKADPAELKPFVKKPMTDEEARNHVMKQLFKGFLLLSIPGFCVGFVMGALIF